MSIRCHIGFYASVEQPNDQPHALIYRHCDGYPDTKHGVVAQLLPWMRTFHASRGLRDAEYAAARGLMALITASGSVDQTTGYGICGNHSLHGDHEFFYRVDPQGLTVFRAEGDDWEGLVVAEYHPL